jgi:hypothetical protein
MFLIFDDLKIEFGINSHRFHRYTSRERFEYIEIGWHYVSAGMNRNKV